MREPSQRRPQPSEARPAEVGDDRRGRRRHHRLTEHFARTRELIEAGAEDEIVVARSRGLLRRYVDDVVDEVYRRLLAHPETAVQFSEGHGALADANGSVVEAGLDIRREAFRRWLIRLIDGPLDGPMSDYVAAVGHAHVRPREAHAGHINAGFLLITMSWVQTLFLGILADASTDASELARHARRLVQASHAPPGSPARRLQLH